MQKVTKNSLVEMYKKFYNLHKAECKKMNNRYLATKHTRILERVLKMLFARFSVISFTNFYILDFRVNPKIHLA